MESEVLDTKEEGSMFHAGRARRFQEQSSEMLIIFNWNFISKKEFKQFKD